MLLRACTPCKLKPHYGSGLVLGNSSCPVGKGRFAFRPFSSSGTKPFALRAVQTWGAMIFAPRSLHAPGPAFLARGKRPAFGQIKILALLARNSSVEINVIPMVLQSRRSASGPFSPFKGSRLPRSLRCFFAALGWAGCFAGHEIVPPLIIFIQAMQTI